MPVLVGIGHDVDAPIATMVADWSASTPTAGAHVINDSWAPLTQDMPALISRIVSSFRMRVRTLGEHVPHHVATMCASFRARLQALEYGVDTAMRTSRHAVSRILSKFRSYEQTLRHAWTRIPVRLREQHVALGRASQIVLSAVDRRLHALSRAVSNQERLLRARDPAQVLARGYSIVRTEDGSVVRSVRQIAHGSTLQTRLTDGTVESTVTGVEAQT
jgi:Exonuclease VII, large subunit